MSNITQFVKIETEGFGTLFVPSNNIAFISVDEVDGVETVNVRFKDRIFEQHGMSVKSVEFDFLS